MSAEPIRLEANRRSARMLRTAFGSAIGQWLADPEVIEIMLNPDGRLWVDRLGQGIAASPHYLNPADGERIIRLVAHHVGAEVHARMPRVAELIWAWVPSAARLLSFEFGIALKTAYPLTDATGWSRDPPR